MLPTQPAPQIEHPHPNPRIFSPKFQRRRARPRRLLSQRRRARQRRLHSQPPPTISSSRPAPSSQALPRSSSRPVVPPPPARRSSSRPAPSSQPFIFSSRPLQPGSPQAAFVSPRAIAHHPFGHPPLLSRAVVLLPRSSQFHPAARSSQIQPDPARSGQIQPHPARSSHIQPDPARSSQIRPDPATFSHIQPDPATSIQIRPDPARSSHIQPHPAKNQPPARSNPPESRPSLI
ncbi:hypothetical protein ACLOJK_019045 [Asimina triloba]